LLAVLRKIFTSEYKILAKSNYTKITIYIKI
jgi:hypothetical protein